MVSSDKFIRLSIDNKENYTENEKHIVDLTRAIKKSVFAYYDNKLVGCGLNDVGTILTSAIIAAAGHILMNLAEEIHDRKTLHIYANELRNMFEMYMLEMEERHDQTDNVKTN